MPEKPRSRYSDPNAEEQNGDTTRLLTSVAVLPRQSPTATRHEYHRYHSVVSIAASEELGMEWR